MASIAATLPASNSALAAQPSAADAPDGDFDSVLASYAPANDAAQTASPAPAKKPVQVSSTNEAQKLAPKEIKPVKGVRFVEGPAKTLKASAKSIAVAKPSEKDADSKPVNAITQDAKADTAASPIAPIAAVQPVPSSVAFAAGTLAQQPAAELDASSDEDPAEAPAVNFDSNAPAPKIEMPAAGKPLVAREQNKPQVKLDDALQEKPDDASLAKPGDAPQAKPDDAPQVQSSSVPQKNAASPVSSQAMDAIAAAVKDQMQKPEAAAPSPAAQTGIGSITAMLNAVRGTITALVTPKQADVAQTEPKTDAKIVAKPDAKPDAKPAPVARIADMKPDAAQIQPDDDAPEATAKTGQQPAQDAARDRTAPSSGEIAKPEVAAPVPSTQPTAPVATNVNAAAPVVTQNVAANLAPTSANGSEKAPQGNPQTSVPANVSTLATAIAAKSAAGTKTFDIRMDPPELGRVDVHLSVDSDGKVQALLRAEHPQTLELLQRDSQNLERALKDAGLNLSNNSLNFSLKGEQRQGDGGGASMARARSLSDAVVARAEAANASEINFSAMRGNGRLDIRV